MTFKRSLAKLCFWLFTRLNRFQTRQRVWAIDFDGWDPDSEDMPLKEKPHYVKLPNAFAMKCMRMSMHLDSAHWDHWALVHEDCGPTHCDVCGGCYCEDISDDDEFVHGTQLR